MSSPRISKALSTRAPDVASDGPVVGCGGVAEHHLHRPSPDPADHEELSRHRHVSVRPGIARQAAELADQLVEVVGQVEVHGHRRRLAVLPVHGDDEVDVVLSRVLEVVVEEFLLRVVGGFQTAVIPQVKRLGVFIKGVHG